MFAKLFVPFTLFIFTVMISTNVHALSFDNEGSGTSCHQVCIDRGMKCDSIGFDTSGVNGMYRRYNMPAHTTAGNGGGDCTTEMMRSDTMQYETKCKCSGFSGEICGNLKDDNNDGQWDCDDPNCGSGAGARPAAEGLDLCQGHTFDTTDWDRLKIHQSDGTKVIALQNPRKNPFITSPLRIKMNGYTYGVIVTKDIGFPYTSEVRIRLPCTGIAVCDNNGWWSEFRLRIDSP